MCGEATGVLGRLPEVIDAQALPAAPLMSADETGARSSSCIAQRAVEEEAVLDSLIADCIADIVSGATAAVDNGEWGQWRTYPEAFRSHEATLMAIESFDQFLELLHARPDWRQELQRVVLTARLLSLPDTVAELADAQVRTEARVAELAQAQVRTEARVEELAQAQVRTEARVEELAQAQQRTEERLQALIEQVSGISLRADEFMGFMVEQRYRQKAHAYFAPILRRIHVLSGDELDRLLEDAIERGVLDERDSLQLRWADAVIRGRRDGEETYLVVEASVLVDLEDVRRAADRAHFLRLTGPPALPVAAGRRVTPAAVAEARSLGVWLVTNGRVDAPPDMAA